MKALVREPLVHFLVLGAVIFGLFAIFDDTPAAAPADQVVVTEEDVRRLAERFAATWRRPPTGEELSNLVTHHVREEVLVREAEALGLDRGDAVVRQRMVQKMTFLAEGGAEALPATDEALSSHLEAHRERFETPATVAFEQVMLRPDVPDDAARAAFAAGAEIEGLAAATILPARMRRSTRTMVDGAFGAGFFDAVATAEPGAWIGPVDSAFGRHMVRLSSADAARLPPLAEIREAVEQDWRAAQRDALVEERIEALVSRYEVVRPDLGAALER